MTTAYSTDALLASPRMAAEILGVSHPTARKMMHDGTLPVVWIRTRPMVRISDLEAFVAAGGHRIGAAS